MKNTPKTQHGGARSNAGRKKLADPKQPITVYVEKSKIENAGGKDQYKTKLYKLIN